MKTTSVRLGAMAVTDGRLLIGDADFPPVGTEVREVPVGEFEVMGEIDRGAQ